jgi:hypothetical protein
MARKKKTSTVRVNFKGVESRRTPPEGDYILKVLEATNEASKSSGGDMITFALEIAKGEYKGAKVWFYCPLEEKSLWKLHAFLTALGVDAPQDEMDIDLNEGGIPDALELMHLASLDHEDVAGPRLELLPVDLVAAPPLPDELHFVIRVPVRPRPLPGEGVE